MPRLPTLTGKKMVALLLKLGFFVHHQKGSHVQLHSTKDPSLRVTVPQHSKFDLPPFVLGSILKQANITRDEFIRVLKDNK